jgi:hypothetical protein
VSSPTRTSTRPGTGPRPGAGPGRVHADAAGWAPLLFTSAPFVATVVPVTAVYNDAGQLTLNDVVGVRLVATDNPLETYTNWLWRRSSPSLSATDVLRNSFSFRLPADTTVDLATVQTVAVVNGVPTTAERRATRVPG